MMCFMKDHNESIIFEVFHFKLCTFDFKFDSDETLHL